MAVMAAREGLGFEPPIVSDCAPLAEPVMQLLEADVQLHCLRDLTRGGLATALIEIARTAGLAMRLKQAAVPVSDPVRGACENPRDRSTLHRQLRALCRAGPGRGSRALARCPAPFQQSAAIFGTVETRDDPGKRRAPDAGRRLCA
jgi:hydrogenase expression/formation protein HypE